MKVKRAMEILTLHANANPQTPLDELIPALKMGIGALEQILRLRAKGWAKVSDPLPGETEQ